MPTDIWSELGRSLVVALQLLTRIPTPNIRQPQAADYGRSVLVYPLVGLLIGLLLAMGLALLNLFPGDHGGFLPAAILLALWVALTGALHLDGLGDSVDAWVGGYGDRKRSLEILKDPSSGPMAVSAIVAVLLLKFAALTELVGSVPWPWLLVAPLLGRSALVAAFLFIPYARPQGLGSEQAGAVPRGPALMMLSLTALATLLLCGLAGLMAIALSIALFMLLRRATLQRLGGFTGDIAGALCELTETVVLVALALSLGGSA